jgi:hypothetical protein
MRGILADVNAEAHARAIVSIWTSDAWRDLWQSLGLVVESLPSLGLPYNASDALIWRSCQRVGLILLTGNRNADGPESLEATIRNENRPDSLPVITVADMDRMLRDRPYAEKVAERFLETLIAIDDFRGTGRLYVPWWGHVEST